MYSPVPFNPNFWKWVTVCAASAGYTFYMMKWKAEKRALDRDLAPLNPYEADDEELS